MTRIYRVLYAKEGRAMEIVVSQEQGRVPVTIFHIKGEIISDVELSAKAEEAFRAGTRDLLLDLREVPYMSSQGLRALHFIYTLLRTDAPGESDQAVKSGIAAGTFASPHLKLFGPSAKTLEILKITGYDMFLEIHQDLKRAIASFGQS
jgi:anti-anti-sigma regulatory factor